MFYNGVCDWDNVTERIGMGSYTYIDNHSVRIVNKEGLKDFFAACKDTDAADHYIKALAVEGEYLNFEGMNGWKIIQYWYTGFLEFLRGLAIFVEGEVLLRHETNEEFASIVFRDAECLIKLGEVAWEPGVAVERFSKLNNSYINGIIPGSKTDMGQLPQYLKRQKLMRKI